MATSALPNADSRLGSGADQWGAGVLWPTVVRVLQPVASLKLTVGLLALSIILVFIGTLAQVEQDMWDVIADYFDAWACWVPLRVLFPRTWFPDLHVPDVRLPFVGGKLLGLTMLVNLFSAHLIRFKIQARGTRLAAGLGVLLIGVLVTTWVVVAGQGSGGLQGKAPISWPALWTVLKVLLAGAFGASVVGCFTAKLTSLPARVVAIGVASLLGISTLVLWTPGNNMYLGDAGMRIMWQLMQAEFAALWLLGGAWLLFRKRAGVVVIHAGIGLLMLGQLLVSLFAVEERMTIQEGETVNYVHDIRAVELAIVDTSDPQQNHVVAVPLVEKGKETKYLHAPSIDLKDSRWPFQLKVVKFYKNATVKDRVDESEPNPATAGFGKEINVVELRKAAGADSDGTIDHAAVWVQFTSRDGQTDLGTYVLSQLFANVHRVERLEVDGRTFELSLRFKRTYKPYAFTLIDVSKTDYPGTSVPKDYSSELRLVDNRRDFADDVKIRMNEPLRYEGETFYQSKYDRLGNGNEITELQVVTNMGWMIPYVACMIVGTGMFAHFGIVLTRFLDRLGGSSLGLSDASGAATVAEKEDASAEPRAHGRGKRVRKAEAGEAAAGPRVDGSRWAIPVATLVLFGLCVGGLARQPKAAIGEFDFYAFGQIPVQEKGRIKPLDTFARNTLRMISNRETFVNPAYTNERDQTRPAIEWLAEVISNTDEADDFEVFRIDNLDVLNKLQLERRKSHRYSVNDLREHFQDLQAGIDAAVQKPKDQRSVYERKLLELAGRIEAYAVLRDAFLPLPLPPLPTQEEFEKDRAAVETRIARIRQMLMTIPEADRQLAAKQPPRVIPPSADRRSTGDDAGESDDWVPYSTAFNRSYLASVMQVGHGPDKATVAFSEIIDAFGRRKAEEFNKAVAAYQHTVERQDVDAYSRSKTAFESWFNQFSPFFYMMFFYVLAFVVTGIAWLSAPFGWSRSLHRTAYWLVVGTFAVHTFALIARIVISGRPPVTNLYSSAIFIGWACVVAGVVLEPLLRYGIGNTVAAFAGFLTLLIAHYLSLDGDTVAVMVAVLDTQFWLSTHVVCITLGYAATLVAGLLGIVYVITSLVPEAIQTPMLRRGATVTPLGKLLATSIYGVLCFAILFSFVGTVLGGLWADDSWGRFWGWDPKENGALIIVLWNALILHTRWDGLVRERGLAVLAIGGNIVTCWSWFGVNELGVGLHSYGFTEGVLMYLTITVAVHLLLMATALVPWWRDRTSGGDSPNKPNLAATS